MTEFRLTRHAAARAVDMALDPEFIRELVTHPDVKRWTDSPDHGGCWLYRKGDIAAPIDEDDGVLSIRTFLPATRERWEREDALPIPGRRFDEKRWETPWLHTST